MAHEGMRVVGVRTDTKGYQRLHIGDFMRTEPAALMRALVLLEEAQESLRITRLSTVSRMSYLPGSLPPHVTR